MSSQQNKDESKYVSRRVQQTKKEIEQLKSELQKLINKGINTVENDKHDGGKIVSIVESEHQNQQNSSHAVNSDVQPFHFRKIQSSSVNHKNYNRGNITSRVHKSNTQGKNSVIEREKSPKKQRHYNVEEAREYIKKQKEKRLDILKSQVKVSQKVVDMRKEKLKELQTKSLQLVKRNIEQKREKIGSRENLIPKKSSKVNQPTILKTDKSKKPQVDIPRLSKNHFDANGCLVPDLIVNNVKHMEEDCARKRAQDHLKANVNAESNVHPYLQNVTIRTHDFDVDATMTLPLPKQSPKYDQQHHDASIKIQAAYKGYRQRKLYKLTLKMKKELEENARKLAEEAVKREAKLSNINVDDSKNKVPFWLEYALQPYPYNFITAVKHKLNLAISTPSRVCSDVAVQSSFHELLPSTHQPENKQEFKLPDESLRTASKHSYATSFLSHKCLDLNLKNVGALQLHIKSDVNDCDTERDSIGKKPEQARSKYSKQYSNCFQSSESDTSKNIPDISSESAGTVGSVYSSKSTDDKRDTVHSETSDFNLKINVEKLKGLKLRERSANLINTMHLLSTNDVLTKQSSHCSTAEKISDNSRITAESTNHLSSDKVLGRKQFDKLKSKNAPDTLELQLGNVDYKISQSVHNFQGNDTIIAYNTSDNSKSKSSSNKISHSINNRLNSAEAVTSDIKSNHISNLFESTEVNSIPSTNKSTQDESPKLRSFLNSMGSFENFQKSRNCESNKESDQALKKSGFNKESDQPSSQSKIAESFKSLLSTAPKSSETNSTQKMSAPTSLETNSSPRISEETELENVQSSAASYSSKFSSSPNQSLVPSLKHPSVTLTTSQQPHKFNAPITEKRHQFENVVSIQPGEVTCFEAKTNQIHVKFEAELHLLNDFNESLRQFMAVEKSLLDLQSRNLNNATIYQHQDTQTSAPVHTTTTENKSVRKPETINTESSRKIPTINYSRGSEVTENLSAYSLDNSILQPTEKTLPTTGLELSQIDESLNSTINETNVSNILSTKESYGGNIFAGLSLGMFDQLIKDEDSRIENLKTILKIREKALLDRTKGELAWLEIQKKQLIETGHLHEASLLKKKQRGIVIKLQHEKQEMQRLKQMQKAASKERKIILKEQRNMIKAQLSSNNVVTKIKRSVQKDRRHSGPIKVFNLHRETVNTETSVSKKRTGAEEFIVTSHSESIISRISADRSGDLENINCGTTMRSNFSRKTEHAKRSLLMREAALQKRKKAAEELLQWHQRLLEEERKIAELEMAANTIINQVPSVTVDSAKSTTRKYSLKGNQSWLNMTGKEEEKFSDQLPLDQIYKHTKKCASKNKSNLSNNLSNDKLNKFVNSKSSDSSDRISTEILSDANSSLNNKIKDSEETNKSISEQLENSINTENSYLTKNIKNLIIESNHSTNDYTSEFESPEIVDEIIETIDAHISENGSVKSSNSPVQADILENEIDRSKSTLHEIMQNISNITDEISTIYKLSSFVNSTKNELVQKDSNSSQEERPFSSDSKSKDVLNSNNLRNECSESISNEQSVNYESNNVHTHIVKSLSELIKTQSPCQDIRALWQDGVIETPEVSHSKNRQNESQDTITSGSKLQTDSVESVEVESEENNTSNKNDISQEIVSNVSDLENVVRGNFNSVSECIKLTRDSDGVQENSEPSELLSMIKSSLKDINQSDTQYQNDKDTISELSTVNDNSKNHESSLDKGNLPKEISDSINIHSNISVQDSLQNTGIILNLSYGFVPHRKDDSNNTENDTISEIHSQNSNKITESQFEGGAFSFTKKQTTSELNDNSDENCKSQILETQQENESIASNYENTEEITAGQIESIEEHSKQNRKSISNRSSRSSDVVSSETCVNADTHIPKGVTTINSGEISEHNILTEMKSTSQLDLIANEFLENDTTSKPLLGEKEAVQEIEVISEIILHTPSSAQFTKQNDISSSVHEESKNATDNKSIITYNNVNEKQTFKNIETAEISTCAKDINSSNRDNATHSDSVTEAISAENLSSNKLQVPNKDELEKESFDVDDVKSEDCVTVKGDESVIESDPIHTDQTNTMVDADNSNSTSKSEVISDKEVSQKLTDTVIDVKKRVSEILADSHGASREDKSPRLQDIYTTTYDLLSPEHSPEIGSPVDTEHGLLSVTQLYGEEAEALFKKQLAIEQEIKQLEQQQKEQIPYLYIREIPNKPPPPYTPPSAQVQSVNSVLPSDVEQVELITSNAADFLYEAYRNGYLESSNVTQNEVVHFLNTSNVDKECYEFVFDLCKELTIDHYKQFSQDIVPSWLKVAKKPRLAENKPLDRSGLKQFLYKNVKELLDFEKVQCKENTIIKWSRKKRDHVDELLVLESQEEEAEWTNYDEDEVIVKNEVTIDIMNMLLQETADVMSKVLRKKTFLY